VHARSESNDEGGQCVCELAAGCVLSLLVRPRRWSRTRGVPGLASLLIGPRRGLERVPALFVRGSGASSSVCMSSRTPALLPCSSS
jgi:hypothetical protein